VERENLAKNICDMTYFVNCNWVDTRWQ